MLKYIIKDLTAVSSFLPHGIVAGIIIVLLLSVINDRRVRKGQAPFSVLTVTILLMYLFIMLCITFLSRESGSSNRIDMQLFSTWSINTRNKALVIENILLFIPYGFLFPLAVKSYRSFISCFLVGVVTSMGIECMQLITARGFFQIDDILTNTLGMAVGYTVFRLFHYIICKCKRGEQR